MNQSSLVAAITTSSHFKQILVSVSIGTLAILATVVFFPNLYMRALGIGSGGNDSKSTASAAAPAVSAPSAVASGSSVKAQKQIAVQTPHTGANEAITAKQSQPHAAAAQTAAPTQSNNGQEASNTAEHTAPGTLPQADPEKHIAKGKLERGDTAGSLLSEYLNASDIKTVETLAKEVYPLSRLQAGKPFSIVTNKGKFIRFEYQINNLNKLIIEKGKSGFDVYKKTVPYKVEVSRVEGEIALSLFTAVESIGEGPELAMKLADIFAWEVDFIRDIRSGDKFSAIVEKRFYQGNFRDYGRILAARFINQGKEHEGFYFENADNKPGYYNAEGKNLRKAFLKVPLSFTRISSRFSWRRLHPILHIYRPHLGVDYAAPTGTPVKAIGDATVVSAGWIRGGGRCVHLRHIRGYQSKYMHLSRFGSGIKKGATVKQGQVIGYVGSSGLATGPHLDFRVMKNGKYINPASMDNPRSISLTKTEMAQFRKNSLKYEARLKNKNLKVDGDFAMQNDLVEDSTL